MSIAIKVSDVFFCFFHVTWFRMDTCCWPFPKLVCFARNLIVGFLDFTESFGYLPRVPWLTLVFEVSWFLPCLFLSVPFWLRSSFCFLHLNRTTCCIRWSRIAWSVSARTVWLHFERRSLPVTHPDLACHMRVFGNFCCSLSLFVASWFWHKNFARHALLLQTEHKGFYPVLGVVNITGNPHLQGSSFWCHDHRIWFAQLQIQPSRWQNSWGATQQLACVTLDTSYQIWFLKRWAPLLGANRVSLFAAGQNFGVTEQSTTTDVGCAEDDEPGRTSARVVRHSHGEWCPCRCSHWGS